MRTGGRAGFWRSIGGILAGVAALVTAATGVYLALYPKVDGPAGPGRAPPSPVNQPSSDGLSEEFDIDGMLVTCRSPRQAPRAIESIVGEYLERRMGEASAYVRQTIGMATVAVVLRGVVLEHGTAGSRYFCRSSRIFVEYIPDDPVSLEGKRCRSYRETSEGDVAGDYERKVACKEGNSWVDRD